jgi:hypothetical protein
VFCLLFSEYILNEDDFNMSFNVHAMTSNSIKNSSYKTLFCCSFKFITYYITLVNRIDGFMVSVLASSVVDHGFEPQSGQTKDYKIGICCICAKHAALRRKSKDCLPRNQNNSVERHVFARTINIQRIDLAQSGPHHHLIDN